MRTTPITPVGLCALIVLLCLLAASSATAQTLTATDDLFEDRTELTWDVTSKAGDLIKIERASTLIAVRAWNETFHADFTGDPGATYSYCVIVSRNGSDISSICDNGARRIFPVTGFEASDELFEDYVSLEWTDRSEVETGFEVTRGGVVIATLPANTSIYRDTDAVQGTTYSYCVAALKGSFKSVTACDDGTRAFVTPPANVSATDGEFTNKIRITWVDQSDSEDQYTIYRDEVEIGTVPPDSTLFDDVPPLANQVYTYFVTATTGGEESVPIADEGMMAGLTPPAGVAASDEVYDDRVEIKWQDVADTEDGFIVLRDGTVLDTTATGAEAYNDFTAAQDVIYSYCVQAISLADPDSPSTSTQVCDNGERAPVLAPTNMAATDDAFEDQTELTWTNVSTTVMLFNIYRDGDLISNVPAAMPFFTDRDAFSGVTYDYCVSAVTVIGAPTALLADVNRLIESTYAMQRTSRYTGQADENSAETVMRAVNEMVGEASAQGMLMRQGAMMSVAESAQVCDTGSRSLAAPTDVAATYEDHEDHVQVTWTDNSNVEDGYEIYRERDAALRLNGTTGSYASVTGFGTGGDLSEFTVDFWMKNDGPQSEAGLFSYATGTEDNEILLIDTRSLTIWVNGALIDTDVRVLDNQWHHIAVQWENTSGTLQLYIDGVKEFETTGFKVGATIASGGTLVFGQDQDNLGGGFNGSQSFSGSLNHIKFWDAFRTNQSVQNNRWKSLDGTQGELIGYWPLTDGEGSTGSDRKGAGQDVSLFGHTWAETSAPVAGRNLLARVSASRASYGDYTGVPGVEYRYTVRAVDDLNESVPGSDDGKRTLLPPIAVQAGDGVSETEVPISWIDESRAEVGYYVYRRDLTKSDSTRIATLAKNINSYTDTSADFGVAYRYSVVVYDSAGTSEPGFDNGSTLLLPPGDVSASDTYASEVTITWTDESGLNDGYRVLRNGSEVGTTGANATLYEDDTAVAGTTYTYCVEATNGPGASEKGCDTGMIPGAPTGVMPDDLINNTAYVASDADLQDRFGAGVAVSGDYAAVAASGSDDVYFFVFDPATQEWQETDILRVGGNTIGRALTMTNDYLLMGNPGVNAAWMYKRNGSELDYVQALSGSEKAFFGAAVDMDGDYAIVGDNGWDGFVGRAYIYKRNGSSWDLQDEIIYDGADVDFHPDQFGVAVAIDGDYALVGARYDDDNGEDAGAAYIFKRDGMSWTQQAKLLASDGTLGDWFGGAVALDGDVALVGAIEENEGNNEGGATGTGKAYFFKREGNTWTEQVIVEPPNGNSDDQFGTSVAVDGEYAIVGAMFSDAISPYAGASYIYREEGGVWSLVTRMLPGGSEGGEDANQSENFGTSVAMAGAHTFIGADGTNGTQASEGSIYVQPLLRTPAAVTASDGTYAGRIQLRWEDTNVYEDGYRIYRREADGVYELVGTSDIDAELFDDFTADAGGAYTYCVAAYNADNDIFGIELSESIRDCDTGWRPPNGAISGRIAAGAGGATRGATVCLMPDPNGGMLFDGTGGHVRIPHDDAFNFGENDDFTVEAWIRYTGTAGTGTGHANIIAKRADNPDRYPFALMINRNTPGKILLGRKGSTGSETITADTTGLNNNEWHHISVVHDGTAGSLKMYINGKLNIEKTYTGLGDPSTVADLYMGRRGETVEQWFGGQLDEVRIWNRTRTEAEIQADMMARLTGDEAGLVGYWPLDEGTREVAADLTGTSNGVLTDGVFWTPGGGFAACETTDTNGNYAFSNLRYGDEAEISIEPTLTGRSFSPAARTVVLDPNSPVQNQADFTDITSYSVTGVVQFENTTCPVPDVEIYLDEEKDNGGLRGRTEVDGTYSIAVSPSVDDSDLRRIRPQFVNPNNPGDTHTFSPAEIAFLADEDKFDVNFIDKKKRVLEGYYGGSCNTDIGSAEVRIFTENGCFDQTYTLQGNFSIELPPQPYLVQVLNVNTTLTDLESDIVGFFDDLGALPADLTLESDTLALEYHAPVSVLIDGLDTSCPSGIDYVAGSDVLRTLPNVATLQQGENVGLNIRVVEDYGNGNVCNVQKGTVKVFDAIADKPEPVTLVIEDGEAVYAADVTDDENNVLIAAGSSYSTVGGALDLLTGRSINGIDRSFQKSITAIASIENVDPVTATEWAIVTGRRARQSTFVSAITEEFPILILHDPPGSNSYAYMEKGTTMCSSLLSTRMGGGGAGADLEFNVGFSNEIKAGLGVYTRVIETGAGGSFAIRTIAGRDKTSLNPNDTSYELCVTPTEGWSTPGDMTWVGEDLYVGVALNLIFAKADDLAVDACELTQEEVLAMDLNLPDPFETTYVYGGSHIQYSLLPALRELEALGQEQVEGELKEEDTTIRITDTITNWENQLLLAERLTEIGLEGKCADVGLREGDLNGLPEGVDCPDGYEPVFKKENRSFSSGADYEFSEAMDSTAYQDLTTTRVYVEGDGHLGVVTQFFGFEQQLYAAFEFRREWVKEEAETETTSSTVGYVLSDGDTGDYFSVDVGTDPYYGTPVFGIVSGRSSNPWEEGTQQRDGPSIEVSPPELYVDDADAAGSFEVTLANVSESQERRQYVLGVPGETNIKNLGLTVTGDLLGGERLETFLLESGQAKTINLDVFRAPSAYSYEDVGLFFYPATEYEIWKADPRQSFALSDTAFFSVYFEAPCSDIEMQRPREDWIFNATNLAEDGGLGINLWQFAIPVSETDTVATVGFEYRLLGNNLPGGDDNGWRPGGTISRTALGDDAESWNTDWLPQQDGAYELRAFTECQIAGPGARVYSPIMEGIVDTKAPEVFGIPQPADQILTLGTDIAISFDEEIDCGSVITNGNGTNATLTFTDDNSTITGVQAVCDGRTLYLSPPSVYDWSQAENRVLEARVLGGVGGITDAAGNPLASAAAWSFTVQRNVFAWQPANRTVNVQVDTEGHFSAGLVNGRTEAVDWTLAGVPAWLTPSDTLGTLPPGGETTLSFTIADTLTLGTRVDTLRATTDRGDALFYLTVNVQEEVCVPPMWTVDPAAYQYSMAITAQAFMDGVVSEDGSDLLAAFVGGELRGVAPVVPQTGGNRVSLLVYSNTAAGETVTFQAYDASTCTRYPGAAKTFTFVNGDLIGTDEQPEAINASFEVPQQQIPLAAGWTWFSLNRTPGASDPATVLSSVVPGSGDIVKGQTAFSLYDAGAGWVGALTDVALGSGYQIRLSSANTLVVDGPEVNPTTPIAIQEGWNWLGYLPQEAMNIADALGSSADTYTPSEGDVLKSQFAFETYTGGSWVPGTMVMNPGQGYMLLAGSASSLQYPASAPMTWESGDVLASASGPVATSPADRTLTAEVLLARKEQALATYRYEPDESAREAVSPNRPQVALDAQAYRHSMTVIAEVTFDGGALTSPDALVWLTDEAGVARGEGRVQYLTQTGTYRTFLMLYSDLAQAEAFAVHVYDPATDQVVTLNKAMAFKADHRVGTVEEPLVIAAETEAYQAAQAAAELPSEYALEQNYPNPFNPRTTIRYALPETGQVQLVVYDVIGREVMRLVDGAQKAGHHEIAFDASRLASGVYVYRIEAGTFKAMRKMVLVR